MNQKYVGTGVRKSDARALTTGQPVYTDDIAPQNALIVKVLRSPHAHALIEDINVDIAKKVPGIACVLTYKDVPQNRFTMAGQTFPEPSPYDRLILDRRVRFVGDAVAIVAGETDEAVDRALRMIKVKYEVLEPVLDFHKAKDNPVLIHPEENWVANCPVGADNKRNLCASGQEGHGDIEAVLASCDVVLERTYHTKANQQTPMETFRTFTQLDAYGRLNIISSTQVPFHVRRILSIALGIPKSKVRVMKPRIGGGFGAKQTVVTEVYPAIVTIKTGRPAKIIYTREESMIASSPRHEMEVTVRIGAMKDGTIRGIDLYTLSNTGAFGEHGPTTVGLSRCTRARRKPFASATTLYTPTSCPLVHIVAMAQLRVSLRLSLSLTSWLTSSVVTPSICVCRTWYARAWSCRHTTAKRPTPAHWIAAYSACAR